MNEARKLAKGAGESNPIFISRAFVRTLLRAHRRQKDGTLVRATVEQRLAPNITRDMLFQAYGPNNRHLKGGPAKYNPDDHDLIWVKDMDREAQLKAQMMLSPDELKKLPKSERIRSPYRSVNIPGVKNMSMYGRYFVVRTDEL